MQRAQNVILSLVFGLVASCTSSPLANPSVDLEDAARDPVDASRLDSGAPPDTMPVDVADTSLDAPDASSRVDACSVACDATTLTVTVGTKSGAFDRAQFGFNTADAGVSTAQVEAHFGGEPACPTANSPTPRRTVVFANIPLVVGEATEASGVRATLLDFQGDLTSEPIVRATAVKVTVREVVLSPNAAQTILFDVEATLPMGSLRGQVRGAHCASMDD